MQLCVVENGAVTTRSTAATAATAATADDAVPWWSFTKLLIAAAFWRNEIDIERPLRGRGGPFTLYTVKEVLMHRAGLSCYGPLPHYHQAAARGDTPWDADRFWAETKADDLIGEPGQAFAYSNIGYMLLREELECQGIALPFVSEPLEGYDPPYDPRWVAHGLMAGTLADAALQLDAMARDDFGAWALSDQSQIGGPLPGRPWKMPTYGLGVMADMGRCFGHTGQGPGSVFACYHFRREAITIAGFAQTDDQGEVEQAVCDAAAKL
ncbi:MAG: serine hydrolase [Alphaproteobacteria bacterium]